MTFATDEPRNSTLQSEETGETAEAASKEARWYAVQVASGCEKRVKTNLEQRIQTFDVGDKIVQVEIPQTPAVKIRKDGSRQHTEEKVFPGYVLVRMMMDDDTWQVVRNTSHVINFVGAELEALAAVQKVADALNVTEYVTIPEAHRARAAAFVITASEGANLHLGKLRRCPQDFDSATRDRFLAGALIPSSWYLQAQRFRKWYRDRIREIFQNVDIILAPTTPISAPLIGQQTMILDGEEILVRPHLGLFTQPLSFIGLPVLSVPIQRPNALPLGVQLIAAPYNEALILQVAATLEAKGIVSAPIIFNPLN